MMQVAAKEITVPFHPQMKEALLGGWKWLTSRSKRLGEPGDTFTMDGQRFRIAAVQAVTFGEIADQFYFGEGFGSPEEFRFFWIRLHRGHLPSDDEMKWLHVLERIA